MPVKRVVQAEWLDALPPGDPAAARSRRDLRRINRLLGHSAILSRALETGLAGAPSRLVDLGAGDGTLMLELAQARYAQWHGVEVILVDRWPVANGQTIHRFRELGWRAEVVAADAGEWLAAAPEADAMVANLFLHHFEEGELAGLLARVAARAGLFVACETRREWFSGVGARLLGLIGCNAVTRHDARRSVAAGFRDGELSALWPQPGWALSEGRAGLFTHLFVARREG
jgi:hypothetical protein